MPGSPRADPGHGRSTGESGSFHPLGDRRSLPRRGRSGGGCSDSRCELERGFVFHGPEADTPYPHPRSMPQWRTEEVFLAHLESFGVHVERGVNAEEISISEDRATVVCSDIEGREFSITADYLIGAGGAHSPVRGALKEHLEGITYPLRYVVADVGAVSVHRGDNLLTVAVSPQGLLMVVQIPHGRSLIFAELADGVIPAQPVSLDDIRAAVSGHLNRPFEVRDLRWSSMYHSHRRMAPKFAEGRCFLAGDAAHICNPLGGEGLNSGVLDGVSLSWKLAAVLRHGGNKSCSRLRMRSAGTPPVRSSTVRTQPKASTTTWWPKPGPASHWLPPNPTRRTQRHPRRCWI